MRRKLWPTVVVTSLALLCAVAVLWVRSVHHADELQREITEIGGPRNAGSTRTWLLGSHHGGVYFARVVAEFGQSWDTESGRSVVWRYANEETWPFYPLEHTLEAGGYLVPIRPDWRRCGFRWATVDTSEAVVTYAVIPYWFVIAGIAALPLARLAHVWRWRARSLGGFCPACGYDLRATSGRCPECGEFARQEAHNPPIQRSDGKAIL